MKKFVIERILPGAGMLTAEERQSIALESCEVIRKIGVPYHWIESFITDDKIYCIHIAESENIVREHARLANIPIHIVNEVRAVLDPVNGNPL